MPFVFMADGHQTTRGFRQEIPGLDGLIVLEYLIRHMLGHLPEVPFVDGGDMFDKNRPVPWVVNQVTELLERLRRPIYFVQGNHDKHREEAWLDGVDRSEHLGLEPMNVGGHRLVGIDYCNSESFGEALGNAPACDGLVCHQALRQALGFDGAWNADLDIFDDRRIKDVWIGDIHAPTECWNKEHTIRAVYPGAIWPRNIDETKHGPRALLVTDELDDQGHHRYEDIPLPARPVVRLQLDSEDDLKAALENEELITQLLPATHEDQGLDPRLCQPVLHVRYYADILGVEDAFRAIQADLGGGFYVETRLPSREGFLPQTVLAAATGEEAVTFADLVSRATEGQDELRAFALELAGCHKPEEVRGVIEQWREKKLGKVNDNT